MATIIITIITIIINLTALITLLNTQSTIVTVDTPGADRRILLKNSSCRLTRRANFAHRIERRLVKGVRVTAQPTRTKSQGHWHVPEAPRSTPPDRPICYLATRFKSAVNNVNFRRRAAKRLVGAYPEYMFT